MTQKGVTMITQKTKARRRGRRGRAHEQREQGEQQALDELQHDGRRTRLKDAHDDLLDRAWPRTRRDSGSGSGSGRGLHQRTRGEDDKEVVDE